MRENAAVKMAALLTVMILLPVIAPMTREGEAASASLPGPDASRAVEPASHLSIVEIGGRYSLSSMEIASIRITDTPGGATVADMKLFKNEAPAMVWASAYDPGGTYLGTVNVTWTTDTGAEVDPYGPATNITPADIGDGTLDATYSGLRAPVTEGPWSVNTTSESSTPPPSYLVYGETSPGALVVMWINGSEDERWSTVADASGSFSSSLPYIYHSGDTLEMEFFLGGPGGAYGRASHPLSGTQPEYLGDHSSLSPYQPPDPISNLTFSDITSNSISVSYLSDDEVETYVEYDTDPGFSSPMSTPNSTGVTHQFVLPELDPSTEYHLRITYRYTSQPITTSMNLTILTLDFILIVGSPDSGGPVVEDQTVAVNHTLTGYAAGYNSGEGYVKDVEAAWTVQNTGSEASTSPATGVSSTFNAGMSGGTATWRAEYLGKADSVVFTILSPTVDSIEIVDSPGTGMTQMGDMTVPVGYEIAGYAAVFNDTVGYIGDVAATWSISNSGGANAQTSPGNGTSSTFNSGTAGGMAIWMAQYGGLFDQVQFTVLDPTIDSIEIVDSPGVGTNPVGDTTVPVGYDVTGYAAAFNDTVGYLADVEAEWTVENHGGAAASTSPSNGTSSTFNSGASGGWSLWHASYGGVEDSVNMTIEPPRADRLLVRTEPGGGGENITDRSETTWSALKGYAVLWNDT
ncbi:MAG: fibronectin type III domain-containing protein, partial [Thermoplasmata archaeon]|nr:fibronectin type III domain-containing protein [Thermoplasmata archaeon]